MDPISVFTLSRTIFRFIDSGRRFAVLAQRLHEGKSDNTDLPSELLTLTKDLKTLLPQLEKKDNGDGQDDSLAILAQKCGNTAEEMLTMLHKVKGKGINGKREACKAALRIICKEDEMRALDDRLSSFRDQLVLRLFVSIREHAAESEEQQKVIIKELGVIHDKSFQTSGIAGTILQYLVSGRNEIGSHLNEIKELQTKLVSAVYDKGARQILRADSIQLSAMDRETAELACLERLQYDDMIDRENRIVKAHEATLRWVFQDSQPSHSSGRQVRWSSLQDWLQSDNDQLYWITGKPGSGKSTLMKFLCSPEPPIESVGGNYIDLDAAEPPPPSRCWPYLKKWAGSSQLIVASFYFWNSGIDLQMRDDGLYCTLLYQLLAQRPDIIPELVPLEWEALCLFGNYPKPWATDALHDMLLKTIQMLSKDSKICLFIDGLDEFDGGHDNLISKVQDFLRETPNLKVCVASRPWEIFQEAFGQKPSLRLEDLTFDDIKLFVETKFTADREFDALRRRYPEFADKLIISIVTKASGVFLWVDLVVSSLLLGMRFGDRIEDFQRRLDELPPDLERLYEKILQSLDKFYLGHAAEYFLLIETAEAPLTTLQFSFCDEESPSSAIAMGIGPLPEVEMSFRIESMKRRLNSRCKGFLEVERGRTGQDLQNSTVQYLHRTVRDFIKSPKTQSYLQSSINPSFDPSLQLCLAYMMDMKCSIPSTQKVIQCLRQAAKVSEKGEGAVIGILDGVKYILDMPGMHYTRYQKTLYDPRPGQLFWAELPDYHRIGNSCGLQMSRPLDTEVSFISIACIYGVVAYVKRRAVWGGFSQEAGTGRAGGVYFASKDPWPLLMDALLSDVPEPKMVECLLDLGADPNIALSGANSQNPLVVSLTKMALLFTIENEFKTKEEFEAAEVKWRDTAKLLISRGARVSRAQLQLLMPVARQILQDLKKEMAPTQKSASAAWGSWLKPWGEG